MWWYVDARDMRDSDVFMIQVWMLYSGMFMPEI